MELGNLAEWVTAAASCILALAALLAGRASWLVARKLAEVEPKDDLRRCIKEAMVEVTRRDKGFWAARKKRQALRKID